MPIRILDAATVGRIAAGEVVERPSSVVKELVENSLDAGATAVTVEIRGGGIDYLRVTDNGCGIEPGQVRLAFENHATSKLQHADQLDDIRTLGFRGEALPSISSVSRVEMTTRAKNQDSGTRVTIEGGGNMKVQEAGCPEGTTFIMRDLFFNIPVRRAFLKKPAYEGGLVSDAMARLMIGNPGVSMRFINNGNTVYHTYGDGKLRHAVFAVYGKAAAEQMLELDASEGGTRVYGMIGVGELAKSTRAHQMFFINGRSVRCALLTRVLEQVCRSRVTIGMYPMCALNLVLPPQSIDVNVHPNKLEVRFRDETMVQMVVEKLLQTAFDGETVLQIKRDTAPARTVERVATVREITPGELKERVAAVQPVKENVPSAPVRPDKPLMPPLPVADDNYAERIRKERERLVSPQQEENDRLKEVVLKSAPVPAPVVPVTPKPVQKPSVNDKVVPMPASEQMKMPELDVRKDDAPQYRVIGVVFRTYILVEAEETLLLIDQHAAHERLRYELYMKQLEDGIASQQLLIPMTVRLSAREMALIQENIDLLSEAGYTVEPFGEHDIQIRAVPCILGKAELKPLFMDMINSLNRLKSAAIDARREEVMQMACKSAVKGGDVLSDSEIQALIREMLETGAPPTCPHGRPVVKALSRRELEKMFKRIQ